MAQLETTHTFVDGELVNAASLNNVIDQATAQDGIIADQVSLGAGTIDPAADQMLIWDSTGTPTKLRRALISKLPGAGTVTNVSPVLDNSAAVFIFTVATQTTTPVIHLGLDNQTGNKVLAAPADGTSGTPAFRALTPADLPSATVINIAANNIDCTLGNVFYKVLPTGSGPFNITISDLANGQTIKVGISNNAAGTNNVTWGILGGTPPLVWRGGGPAPAVTHAPNGHDIFTFMRITGLTLGYADQAFTT